MRKVIEPKAHPEPFSPFSPPFSAGCFFVSPIPLIDNYTRTRTMDWSHLFSYQGRVGRKEYWLTYLGWLLAPYPPYIFALWFPLLATLLVIFVSLVSVVGMSVLCIKRLHDTNRSGWWLMGPTVASLVLLLLGVLGLGQFFLSMTGGTRTAPVLPIGLMGGLAMFTVFTAINLYVWYVLGVQVGDRDSNRFGAPDSGSVMQER